MEHMGETTKAGKSELGSFDPARAEAIFRAYAQQARTADAFYAAGGSAKAQDLHARFLRFAAAADTASSSATDRAKFRSSFGSLVAECRSCHSVYK